MAEKSSPTIGLTEASGTVEEDKPQPEQVNDALDISAAVKDMAGRAAQASPSNDEGLDFSAAVKDMSVSPAAQALKGASGVDPDQAAKVQDLAQRSGLPPQAVAGNEDQVKEDLDFSTAVKQLRNAPTTAKFLADPDNAAVSRDAVSHLAETEATADKLPPMWKFTDERAFLSGPLQYVGMGLEGWGNAVGAVQGIADRHVADALRVAGFSDLADELEKAAGGDEAKSVPEAILKPVGKFIRDVGDYVAPDPKDMDFGAQAIQGVGQVAAQVAIAYFTGGVLNAGLMYGQGTQQMADDIKEKGVEHGDNTDIAQLIGGGVTAVTEKYELGLLLDKIPSAVRSKFGRILAGASSEYAQEFTEQFLQNLTALALYDPNQDLFEGTAANAEIGGLVGGIISGIIPGRVAIQKKKVTDDLHGTVMGNPLLERSPEKAINHLESVLEQAAVNDVYMSAQKIKEIDPENTLAIKQDKLDEQAQADGDVKLTTGQLARVIADEDMYAKAGEHLRFGAEGMTEAEAKDLTSQDAIRAEADAAMAPELESVKSAAISANGIFEGQTHADAVNAAAEFFNMPVEDVYKIDGFDGGGFVTTEGRYVDRKEALDLANNAEQVKAGEEKGVGGNLISEHTDMPLAERGKTGTDFKTNSPKFSDDVSRESDMEVGLAEEMMGLQGLFRTAKEAGMTQDGYAKYLSLIEKAKDRSRVTQEKKRLKAEQVKLTKAYQEKFAEQKQRTEEAVRQEPVYAALDAIGRDRLSQDAVQAIIEDSPVVSRDTFDGNATVKPKEKKDTQAQKLVDELKKVKVGGRSIIAPKSEGGIDPNVLADRYGFDSAYEMLAAFITTKPVEITVFERTELAMQEQHPELTQEVKGVREALYSLNNSDYSDVIAYELNTLRQARGQGAVKAAAVRREARRRLGQYKLDEISPTQFMRVAARKAREAGQLVRGKPANPKTGKAAVKPNLQAAAKAKFQQLLNFEMAKAAYDAQDRVRAQRKELQRFQNPRQKQEGIDADYVDQIHGYLERINLMRPLTPEARTKLMEKAQQLAAKNGSIFVVPPLVLASDERIQFGDLTLEEWNQFYGVIKNIEAQGRLVKQIGLAKKALTFEDQRALMIEAASNLKDDSRAELRRRLQNPSASVGSVINGLDAALAKVEFLVKQLDNGIPLGPWHTNIFQPIADAQTAELDLMFQHFRPLLKSLEAMAHKEKLGQVIRIEELGRTFTRADIIAMALNIGNESNYQKMLEGSKKDPDGAKEWTDKGIEEALSHLNADEAKWVQSVWDEFEKIYPQVEKIYRQEYGISPERVEPRQTEIGGVKLKGGYFPMMYDAKRAPHASEMKVETALDAMQSPQVRAAVFSGMTTERTGYTAPVLLDLRKLTYGFQQVAHFTTHYEAVRAVRRIVADTGIMKAVRAKLGPEYHKEMLSWLDDVATAGMKQQDSDQFDGSVQYLRSSVTTAVMGASYTTGISQVLGLANTAAILGRSPKGKFKARSGLDWTMTGVEQYLKNPAAAIRNVKALSGEMRHRLANTDRELAHALERISHKADGLPSKLKQAFLAWNQASLQVIGGAQFYTVDVPTWIAAYNKGQYEGMEQADAVKYADHVLRTSQGTGHEKDLSHLQRRKGFTRVVTMFSSYTMVLYNQMRETAQDAKQVKNLPGTISRMMLLVTIPALANSLIHADLPKQPDDPESWAKWLAASISSYALQAFPIVGPTAASMIQGFEPEFTPLESIGKAVSGAITQTAKVLDGGDITAKTVEAYVRAVGLVLGVGGSTQAARALDAIAADSDNPYDFLAGHKK